MGMGWTNSRGGLYSCKKCKYGKGEISVYVNDHEESDYPPFERGDIYTGKSTCPSDCMDIKNMTQHELKYYSN